MHCIRLSNLVPAGRTSLVQFCVMLSSLVALQSNVTSAAQVTVDGSAIRVTGKFEFDDLKLSGAAFAFGTATGDNSAKLSTVVLDSPGGNEGVASFLAADIKKFGLATRVEAGRHCAGACLLVLLSGTKRSIGKSAIIIWTEPHISEPALAEAANQLDGSAATDFSPEGEWARWARFLPTDVSESALKKVFRKAVFAPSRQYRLNSRDLESLGIQRN